MKVKELRNILTSQYVMVLGCDSKCGYEFSIEELFNIFSNEVVSELSADRDGDLLIGLYGLSDESIKALFENTIQ